MIYKTYYLSSLGRMLLAADDMGLVGAWFEGQKYFGEFPGHRNFVFEEKENHILKNALRWLDIYFSGREPDFLPPMRYDSTPFRKCICDIMLTIPYGQTMTYGEIAAQAARRQGMERMSAQAVGGAVGHNPISLMIPCHRVVGAGGNLTGYGGGIDRKAKLLTLEGVDMGRFFIPKKGTAL